MSLHPGSMCAFALIADIWLKELSTWIEMALRKICAPTHNEPCPQQMLSSSLTQEPSDQSVLGETETS